MYYDVQAKLQNIVNLSSFFFRTESATEYATDPNAYGNKWKTGKNLYRSFYCKKPLRNSEKNTHSIELKNSN